jgi:hypothetical protein
MIRKFCMSLAVLVLAFAVFGSLRNHTATAAERTSAGAHTTQTDQLSNEQAVSNVEATAPANIETGLLSNKSEVDKRTIERPRYSAASCDDEDGAVEVEEDIGTYYAILRIHPSPPRFKGIGFDHYARADV